MLRKFSVKNYKNFKDTLSLDFTDVRDYKFNENCVKNGIINKMIVYGRNAEGKSNLGTALYDIYYNAIGSYMTSYFRNERIMYKNADAGSDDLIEFYYSFILNSQIVDYHYSKSDSVRVVSEKFELDNKIIYEYDILKGFSNFENVELIGASDLNWDKFINVSQDTLSSEWISGDEDDIGFTTALRYIIFNTIQQENSIINLLQQFIKGFKFSTATPRMVRPIRSFDKEAISNFEKFLNNYGIKCELVVKKKPDGEFGLYFKHKKPLDFLSNISSGMEALTRFYWNYMYKFKPTLIYMDEFDAFYHYELSENIVKMLKDEFDCQVILTTHNTSLLSNTIMRPDCFFILNDGKITSICNSTSRELRLGHNLEKLYKSGEFDVE